MRSITRKLAGPSATFSVSQWERENGKRLPGFESLRAPSIAPVAPIEPEPAPQPSLPIGYKIALISLSSHPACRAVWAQLKELPNVPKPTLSDFHGLAALGLVRRQHGSRYHELTCHDSLEPFAYALELGKHFGIHAGWTGKTGDIGWNHASCCCGWKVGLPRNQRHFSDQADSAWLRHLREVRETKEAMAGLEKALTFRGKSERA